MRHCQQAMLMYVTRRLRTDMEEGGWGCVGQGRSLSNAPEGTCGPVEDRCATCRRCTGTRLCRCRCACCAADCVVVNDVPIDDPHHASKADTTCGARRAESGSSGLPSSLAAVDVQQVCKTPIGVNDAGNTALR